MRFNRLQAASLIFVFILGGCVETQAPAPVVRYVPGTGAGSTGIHTVLQGETLWLISKHYNIAARDIAVVNNLQAPFSLAPGQRLRLPPPQEYRVRAGDSLNMVSRLFSVSNSEIAQMNNLQPPYTLRAGQVLRLPSVTQKSAPAVFANVSAPVVDMPVAAPEAVQAERLSDISPPRPHPDPLPEGRGDNGGGHYLKLPDGYGQQQQVAMIEPAPVKPEPPSPVTAKVPKRASSKFLKPVSGKVISGYGPKTDGLFNDGVNIAAARGTPVKAAENGVIVYAGDELKGSGNLVLIRHADRWMTAYAHLGSIDVRKGAVVKRGQVIGTVGSSGAVSAPQLHFEVRRGTEALNPQVYVEG